MKGIEIGEILTLSDNKRDIAFVKIGGLNVRVLKHLGGRKYEVEILVTGNTTTVYL